MQVFNSCVSAVSDYYHALPVKFYGRTFTSAYFSFVLSCAVSRNYKVGLQSALLAAIASTIGSLILPLLNKQFGDSRNHISYETLLIVELTGICLIQLLLYRYASAHQIHLFASLFFTHLAVDADIDHKDGFNTRKKGLLICVI